MTVTAHDVKAADKAVREACIRLVQAGGAVSAGKDQSIVTVKNVRRDTPAYFLKAENEYLDALYYYRAVSAAYELNKAAKWGQRIGE